MLNGMNIPTNISMQGKGTAQLIPKFTLSLVRAKEGLPWLQTVTTVLWDEEV